MNGSIEDAYTLGNEIGRYAVRALFAVLGPLFFFFFLRAFSFLNGGAADLVL
jgi:hypothetical protein